MKMGQKRTGNTEDANALILPSNGNSEHKLKLKAESKPKTTASKFSKSQQRKLRRIQEEKEKQARRAAALEILEKNKLTDDEHALLCSSSSIGQVETMRTKLSKAMLFRKAGLEVPSDVPLFQERKAMAERCTDEDVNVENGSTEVAEKVNLKGAIANIVSKEVKLRTACHNSKISSSRQVLEGNDMVQILETKGAFVNDDVQQKTHEQPSTNLQALTSQLGPNTKRGAPTSGNAEENLPSDTTRKRKYMDGENDIEGLNCKDSKTFKTPKRGCLRGTNVVHVSRPQEVEKQRGNLPITMMEQEIMEAINSDSVVIICGETGCGKTTQVPQFLFEAGFGSSQCKERAGIIGVTQPRRVAVLATAKRVAYEMCFQLGKEIGFQVRHDRKIGESSKIKFMTDGILLREVQSDFLLRQYSVIVLDEAHERSLNTDILIGMLSRIVPLRQSLYDEQQRKLCIGESVAAKELICPLKLVIMSATLRKDDFELNTSLFCKRPPVIEVPARQFPVTVHFSSKTELVDYLGKAYKRVLAIHKKLPPGGVLVFVTGQREVELLCRRLRKAVAKEKKSISITEGDPLKNKPSVDLNDVAQDANYREVIQAMDANDDDMQYRCGTDEYELYDDDGLDVPLEVESSSSDTDLDLDTDNEQERDFMNSSFSEANEKVEQNGTLKESECLSTLKSAFEAIRPAGSNVVPKVQSVDRISEVMKSGKRKDVDTATSPNKTASLYVLPLYAMLPAAAQLRVFSGAPEGERLVVVATNVAETSITIPGIKYVVDCGRAKVKEYDGRSGIAKYEIQWISKASAAQRAGRAGRTGPGHCYRLYSSAVFSKFPDFPVPEVHKASIEGTLLVLKNMGIHKVINFPFPTPPEMSALTEGERCLKSLAALDQTTGMLTPLGKAMSSYPINPRHSRMLLTIIQIVRSLEKCKRPNLVLAFALGIAAALSVDSPFLKEFASKDDENSGKKRDALAKRAHKMFENMNSDALSVANALHAFELAKNQEEFCKMNFLHFKTMDEMSKLRKQLQYFVFNQKTNVKDETFTWPFGTYADVELAWREHNEKSLTSNQEDILRQAICAGWVDRVARRIRSHMTVTALPEGDRPKAIRYQSCSTEENIFLRRKSAIARAAPEFVVYNELIQTKRLYMQGVTSINKAWLVLYGGALCTFSKPLADPRPEYESSTDELFCWVSPTFGPHLWELPLHRSIIQDRKQRVSVFACALLQGKVVPCLRSLQSCLAADPFILLKPEAMAQKRVGDLLYRLNAGSVSVDSRAKLKTSLDRDSRFLYSELLSWVQSTYLSQFEALWDVFSHEVGLDHQQLYPKKLQSKKARRKKKSEPF